MWGSLWAFSRACGCPWGIVRFGMIAGEKRAYGACDVEIDFKQRVIEPPAAARKRVAEAYFYLSFILVVIMFQIET